MIDYKNKEDLERLYVDGGLSLKEIAEKTEVSSKTIHYWLKKHDINRRGVGGELPYASFYTAPESTSSSGYEFWRTRVDGKKKTVRVGRLLAIAKYGFDEVVDKDVRYKNGIPWDNREQNIEILTTEEHVRRQHEKQGNPMEGEKARQKISIAKTKSSHIRYNYRGENWKRQREKALERDDWSCQECGVSEDEVYTLHVHHKTPYRTFKSSEKANQLENLVSLCPRCHGSIESEIPV